MPKQSPAASSFPATVFVRIFCSVFFSVSEPVLTEVEECLCGEMANS